jgi:hypothetical protein
VEAARLCAELRRRCSRSRLTTPPSRDRRTSHQLKGFLGALQAHRKLRRIRRLGAQTELLRAEVDGKQLRVVACGPGRK